MDDYKSSAQDQESEESAPEEKKKPSSASRARNRTVMLTPEMTGQVRALLHQAPGESSGQASESLDDFLPPLVDWGSTGRGFGAQNGLDDRHAEDTPAGGMGLGMRRSEESSGQGGTATFSRVDINQAMTQERGQEPLVYDPMTTVAPPARGGFGMQSGGNASGFVRPGTRTQGMTAVNAQPSVSAPSSYSEHTSAPTSHRPSAWSHGRSKLVGFLMTFDNDSNGEVFEVRAGRWLVTSRPTEHGDFILIDDETVSPLHAILRATKDGKIQVLDQLSEYGTGVLRIGSDDEIEVAGGLENVGHGDTIRFGERYFTVCIAPEPQIIGAAEDDETQE